MAPSRKSKTKTKAKTSTNTNTGPWSSSRILNSTSPLVTKDLDIHAFLVTCISGWRDNCTYSEADRRAIIGSLPPAYRRYDVDDEGHLICPVSVDFMLEDPYVKAATGKFKRAVGAGLYERIWQNQARKAMQERREGGFDEFLHEQTEATFGEAAMGFDEGDGEDEDEVGAASSDGEWREKAGKGKRRS